MDKKKRTTGIVAFAILALILMIGTIIVKSPGSHESIRELMRDAVLHETNKISLFGLKNVNPGLISAVTVTGIDSVSAQAKASPNICDGFILLKILLLP